MDISGKGYSSRTSSKSSFAKMHAGFRIYVTHMRFRRVERHAQLLGNLLDGAPCHQQRQHLALAIRQPKALGNLRAAVRKSMTSLFVKHLGNVGSIDGATCCCAVEAPTACTPAPATAAAQPRPASSSDPAAAPAAHASQRMGTVKPSRRRRAPGTELTPPPLRHRSVKAPDR